MQQAARMDGRICLVTGANRGIGKALASELFRLGARVILTGRSHEHLDAACQEIRERHQGEGRGVGEVESRCFDLASMASVRNAAAKLMVDLERLDVLVNNAAVVPRAGVTTEEGIEMQLAVNSLGPFLLTHCLLPALRAAPVGRIVNVSSNAHFRAHLHLENWRAISRDGEPEVLGEPRVVYSKQERYKETKLANVLFTYALARRLQGTSVSVNAVRPGTINTGLVGDFLWPFGFLRWIFVCQTTSYGAAPIVRLATDPGLEGTTGRYFDRFRERRSSEDSYDEDLQERLWERSLELTGASPSFSG